MPLTKLTATGADDYTNLDDITDLSCTFPFLEWGILFGSYAKTSAPRFPTRAWVENLLKDKDEGWVDIPISAHLCGSWVRKLSNNELQWEDIVLFNRFNRIQINKNYYNVNDLEVIKLVKAISNTGKNIIFQNNGSLPKTLVFDTLDLSSTLPEILFDCSGGEGVLIRDFPAPVEESEFFHKVFHGYAGGIGPSTIERVINEIDTKYPNLNYWLDMETMIRTEYKLDMNKVEQCAKIAERYIK